MNWTQLLSDKRLGKCDNTVEYNRTAFQKDVDRIIFSSAFRRLQDKTQVFPLAQNDYVRTRLTHSLEVSSVGRSLGTLVGKYITARNNLSHITADDFGGIVAAACLAHDIGNPPFGHFGEEAIRAFFHERPIGKKICDAVSETQRQDLLRFEGNAQGFRILTQLQNPDVYGGMQLTYATLGAFTKYPCTEKFRDTSRIASKKNGLLESDIQLFTEVANELGLIAYQDSAWVRHPLVYLMEAADDICYAIIDIEDAHQIKLISFEKAYDLLRPLAATASDKTLKEMHSNSDKLSYLRAKAIGNLVQEAVTTFMDNEKLLLSGNYNTAISEDIHSAQPLKELTDYAAKNIYNSAGAVETQIAGYKILGDLLEMFCEAMEDVSLEQQDINNKKKNPYKAKAISRMVINLLPERFIGKNKQFSYCPYQRSLKIIDYVSGMTDSFAVNLHRKMTFPL